MHRRLEPLAGQAHRQGKHAADIVAKARFEFGKIELVADQTAEGEFEGAR